MKRWQRKSAYQSFLQSDYWLETRARKLAQQGVCERCGTKHHLEIHHRSYHNGWHDNSLSNLQVLCHKCHQVLHGFVPREPVKPRHFYKNEKAYRRAKRASEVMSFHSLKAWVKRERKYYDKQDIRKPVNFTPGMYECQRSAPSRSFVSVESSVAPPHPVNDGHCGDSARSELGTSLGQPRPSSETTPNTTQLPERSSTALASLPLA